MSKKIDQKTEKDYVKKAFDFLVKKYSSSIPFSKKEFEESTRDPNFDTYFSKKYRYMLELASNEKDKFFVSTVFKKYNRLDKFRKQVSQSTRTKGNYSEEYYDHIMIFEFFLPMNNETALRSALDDLFYKDTIKLMFNKAHKEDLYKAIPKKKEEKDEEYIERLCNWISERFGGYSIGTVSGRSKADNLKTFEEMNELLSGGRQYLIDETTAIVRFIFHIGKPIEKDYVDYSFDHLKYQQTIIEEDKSLYEEAIQIKYFFKILFVKTILTLVEGENEIWMIESGLNKPRLYIWKTVIEE